MITYVLHPGLVYSRHDGQTHYIGATQLVRLYQLQPSKHYWVVGPECGSSHSYGWREPDNAVHLYPRDDGNYSLPMESV